MLLAPARNICTPSIASFPGSTTKPGNVATGPFQFPVLSSTFDTHKAGAMLGYMPQNAETGKDYMSDREGGKFRHMLGAELVIKVSEHIGYVP